MSLVVLVSAKGAPGVTTLTVALAALTPGAVAADLDPDGGDLALRYRRPDGAPLDAETGLLSLVAGLRRDQPGHRWLPTAALGGPVAPGADGPGLPEGPTRLEDHLQVTGGGLDLLLGVNGPEQAGGLGPLWSPLARALSEAGRTVFADCGRVGPASPTMPVLHQADAVIVVARPELEELAHLRERLRFLNSAVPGRFAGRAQIGVVLVAPERDRAVAGRTEQLLHSSGVGVPVLGTVALDQKGAEALRGMNRSRLARSTLIRSVRSLLPSVSLLAGSIPELSGPVEAPRPSRFTTPPQTSPQAPTQPPAQSSAQSPGQPSPQTPAGNSTQTSTRTSARPSAPQTANPAGASPLTPEPEVNLFAEPRGKVTVPPAIAPTPIPATAATISATTAAAISPAHQPSEVHPTSAAHRFSSAHLGGQATSTGPATPASPADQTDQAAPGSPAHLAGQATPAGSAYLSTPAHPTGQITSTSPAHEAISSRPNDQATPTESAYPSTPVPPTGQTTSTSPAHEAFSPYQTGDVTTTGQATSMGQTRPDTPENLTNQPLAGHQASAADPSDQTIAAHQALSSHQALSGHQALSDPPASPTTETTATGLPTPTAAATPTTAATSDGPITSPPSTTAALAPTDVAAHPRPQIVELPATGTRPAPELRPGSRIGARLGSRSERRARSRNETTSETTGEQTLPLRRQNSFFGDAPPVDEDPNLLPLTVAPGVYTPAPVEQQPEPEPETVEAPKTTPSVRGFAGLTTPPIATPHTPEAQSPAPNNEAPDELRHTRSRRAAFGRDPGTLQTSERRRARRHVMPSEENEKTHGSADYGNQAGEGTPVVGTWLQERGAGTDTPEPTQTKPTNNDALGWGWAKDQGEGTQPRATRNLTEPPAPEPAAPEDELPPLPRRDPKLAETRGFPEPAPERRDNGTGWIPPDVPPSDLPLLPSSVPTSMPTPVSVSSDSSSLGASEPATVSSLPVDRTDILREIRDRARRGTDGSGTWAGHLRSAGTPTENETSTDTLSDTSVSEAAGPVIDPSVEAAPKSTEDDDRDTAIVRLVRDPYEPPERYEGAADSPEPPEGGR
ncbi:hypothetical protein LWF15_09035 [Kineosporia rhizophila]|uniref:hypothetical protein n=1 Tax=Kineosporia rhizophila TaxID=84633 RepID=UPI001E57390C|nr:hypothetical protein [Kineosporia rhizophila]MCE0535655.1 hypothetical protein [Kineosporia rhizophila]